MVLYETKNNRTYTRMADNDSIGHSLSLCSCEGDIIMPTHIRHLGIGEYERTIASRKPSEVFHYLVMGLNGEELESYNLSDLLITKIDNDSQGNIKSHIVSDEGGDNITTPRNTFHPSPLNICRLYGKWCNRCSYWNNECKEGRRGA